MTVTALDTHPVPACVQTLERTLDAVDTSAWEGLDPTTARELITRLAKVEARIAAHKIAAARVLERENTARKNGGVSTGGMIGFDFGGNANEGNALVRTAKRLERETTLTEAALARAQITRDQADVIAHAMARLPESATAEQRLLAERSMLKDAPRMSLRDLRLRGMRITDAYQPTPAVDADEDEILRQQEAQARAKTQLRFWSNHDGTTTGKFTLPDAQAAMLKTALDALAAPHQKVGTVNAATGEMDEIGYGDTYPQRIGLAFATLVELLPADRLPSNGGVSATVTVNLDYDTLVGGLKAAGLSDGTRISAEQARRLACTAQLLPMVLGKDSLPLDLGTPTRYFNKASRRAMEKRDGGCTAPGCERDSRWCEAHHLTPYSISGETDIRDGALLCTRHHHHAHALQWQGRINPDDGHVEWKTPGSTIWERNQRWRP